MISFRLLRFMKESRDVFHNALSDLGEPGIHDNIGRIHLPVPHSGPLHLRLHANKYHPSTNTTGINDLYKILKENHKPSCIILSHGGFFTIVYSTIVFSRNLIMTCYQFQHTQPGILHIILLNVHGPLYLICLQE